MRHTKINFVIYFLFLSSAIFCVFVTHPCNVNARLAREHAHICSHINALVKERARAHTPSPLIYCLWLFYQFLFCTHNAAIECAFSGTK